MKNFFPYVLLAVVVSFTYHQLLSMYFWRDDYTGLYVSQLGNLSQNPIFAYPYHLGLMIDEWGWLLFGMNATYYFLAAIILYLFTSWLLFYFLQKLFLNKTISFFCALVFAAGFIGQDDMKMFMDGSNALVALIFLLTSLITLLFYHHNNLKLLFFCSLISFFLTLEIAPHRASTSLIILLALDWVLSWRKRNGSLLLRNASFLLVFILQVTFHPLALFLGYRITSSAADYTGLIRNFSPLYVLNLMGTFWNMVIPTPLQEQLNTRLGLTANQLTLVSLWLSGLPTILFAVVMIIYLRLLRPVIFTLTTLGKIFILAIIVSLLWAGAIYKINIDKGDLVAIFNGGMLLVFLLIWICLRTPKFKLLSLYSLVAIFGILAIFFITIPDRVLVSYNRYLLLPSFTVAFLPIIFVTKEFYEKNLVKKRLSQILFLTVVAVLVLPRLIFNYSTQKEFIQNYSQHAKKMYQDLSLFIPKIDQPTIIYIEGANKELQFAVGDAARVGYFGSEVAYAVHYKTQKENIILPQTTGEISDLLKKNPNLSRQNVYTFIYDNDGLRDTSGTTRELLMGQNQSITIQGDKWEEKLSEDNFKILQLSTSIKVWTLLPLKATLPLKVSGQSEEKKLQINWEYNTSGLVSIDKIADITTTGDNLWHEYSFIIPSGGEYLKSISFAIPLDTRVEVGTVVFSNILDH